MITISLVTKRLFTSANWEQFGKSESIIFFSSEWTLCSQKPFLLSCKNCEDHKHEVQQGLLFLFKQFSNSS